MRLTAFQADKGDCLLLESRRSGHRVLVDGGMTPAYTKHVAPTLGSLREQGGRIDVAYVSHIDADHIAGVLRLLDDEADWRVHEHQLRTGNRDHPPPTSSRPPEIGAIFHNAFHDQLTKNRGEIEDALAASALVLGASEDPLLAGVAAQRRDLANSVPQAMRVSRRINPNQLNIPLNPQFGGKLMLVDDNVPTIEVGGITLKAIGPFKQDLRKLREEWNTWLRKNGEAVKKIRAEAARDQQRMDANDVERAFGPLLVAADRLALELELDRKVLGRRSNVTTPNLASLMFLAEVDGRTILLTGDAHGDDILRGLDHHGALDANRTVHVDVLKVQHHGSENNIDKPFCDAVTADAYVFSGNGEHENPDLAVVELVFDRRMANDQRKFRFWFTSSSKVSGTEEGRAHMDKIERLAARLAKASKQRLTNHFIRDSSFQVH